MPIKPWRQNVIEAFPIAHQWLYPLGLATRRSFTNVELIYGWLFGCMSGFDIGDSELFGGGERLVGSCELCRDCGEFTGC